MLYTEYSNHTSNPLFICYIPSIQTYLIFVTDGVCVKTFCQLSRKNASHLQSTVFKVLFAEGVQNLGKPNHAFIAFPLVSNQCDP